jgi:hypothetical protein
MPAQSVEHVRQQWEEGHRRLEAEARDRGRREQLYAQVDVILAELRRRVGETFTLAQLAEAYGRADDWSREAVSERAPSPGWLGTLSVVQDAAFHAYARGASDYSP